MVKDLLHRKYQYDASNNLYNDKHQDCSLLHFVQLLNSLQNTAQCVFI